jgi:hypothetical protein
MNEITHLQRREIQAPVAACLIREFAARIGWDKAVEVAAEAIRADAEKSGPVMAVQYGGNSLRELGRVVREVWAADDAITVEVREETEREFRFDVVRCKYAELYERLGMNELGFCLSCSRDGAFARGFNPRIGMERTQTIMEGAPCCDFRFVLKESSSGGAQ